jgi:opacity protein-like surface antigen
MRRLFLILLLVVSSATFVSAQETPRAEIFGGYSYLRFKPADTLIDGFNLNGWNASVAGNVNRWFGVVADFSGHYGTPRRFGVDTDIKTHSFLFGPRFSYRRNEKFTPFAHALFGVTNARGRTPGISSSQTGFAAAIGGGLDVRASERVAIRVVQADYLLTRLKGEEIACVFNALLPPCPVPQTDTQHNVRLSFGVVFRFGK